MKKNAQNIVRAGLFGLGMAVVPIAPHIGMAETPAEACARMAGDNVKLDAIPTGASESCAAAVAAAPQDKQLQYDYARALENGGQRDQAKQVYQWIASDGFAPATAALARMAGPLTGDAADREKMAQRFEAVADVAARLVKTTPHDHDDTSTLLTTIGKDPVKMQSWVKNNTRILPYAGMLRGASGVLMDRAGNSLDRAMFQAELLHRAGYNVRIARSQVSATVAAALRQRFVNSARAAQIAPIPDRAKLIQAISSDPRIDPQTVQQAVDQTLESVKQFRSNADQLLKEVSPAVLQSIGTDPHRDAQIAGDTDNAMRDHFWVQWQVGNLWNDADPDADIVGKQNPSMTFLPGNIPAELKQRVSIKISIESLTNGKLSETALLQQSALPADYATHSITLTHSLFPALSFETASNAADPQAELVRQLNAANVVMPILQVGNQRIRGKVYNFEGRVGNPNTQDVAALGGAAIIPTRALGAGIASVFGDSGAMPAASSVTVTAEWLEIDVSMPGLPLERHRRAIFDLIGSAARAGKAPIMPPTAAGDARNASLLALSGTIDAYVYDAVPTSDVITARTASILMRSARRAAAAARANWPASMIDPPPEERAEIALWGWALARGTQSSVPIKPNIALFWQVPVNRGSNVAVSNIFDIVENASISDVTFNHRVSQGVLDTVLEDVIAASSPTSVNAASEMALDISSNRSWVTYAKIPQHDVTDRSATPFELAQEIQNHNIVVAPKQPLGELKTWWRISDRSGLTLGVDAVGRGAVLDEESLLMLNIMVSSSCALKAGLDSQKGLPWKGKAIMCGLGLVAGLGGLAAAENVAAGAGTASAVGNWALVGTGVNILSPWF